MRVVAMLSSIVLGCVACSASAPLVTMTPSPAAMSPEPSGAADVGMSIPALEDLETSRPVELQAADSKSDGCVQDPRADAAGRWWDPLGRGPATIFDFSFEPLPDLDGDGIEDQAVVSETKGCAGAGGNCLNLVYLSRGGCDYAGSFYGAAHTVEALPMAVAGVHDLRVLAQNGCAGRAGDVLRLRWDGTRYHQIESTRCSCPDDSPERRRAPACPQ